MLDDDLLLKKKKGFPLSSSFFRTEHRLFSSAASVQSNSLGLIHPNFWWLQHHVLRAGRCWEAPWEARKHHQDRKSHLLEPPRGGMELMKTADTVTWAMLKIKKIEDRLAHACSVGQFMGLNTLVSMVWIVLLWVPHGSQTKRETKKHGKHTKETIKDLVFFSH